MKRLNPKFVRQLEMNVERQAIHVSMGGEGCPLPTPVVFNDPFADVRLMTGQELAEALRFSGTTTAFRKFLHDADIRPVPRRRDCYDPRTVRAKLDRMQGLEHGPEAQSDSALTRSKMRRNA